MAKKVAKKVTKKRVKKNVERDREMLFHGQVQAVWDLEVQGNLLHMQHRWQLRQQLRQH